jgi:hypothetical protein
MDPTINEATITRFALWCTSLAYPANYGHYHELFNRPIFLNINIGYQHSFQTIRRVLVITAFVTTP